MILAPLTTIMALAAVQAADPDQLRRACVDGDEQACQALMPAASERWALLERACAGGVPQSCLSLAQALSDDPAARRPADASEWLVAACAAGDTASCARVETARSPKLELSAEGIRIDGALQVRFTGRGRWALSPGSTEGQLILPVYGLLRARARDAGLHEPNALPVALEMRIDPDAPSSLLADLIHTAALAGWRRHRVGPTGCDDAELVATFLPARGQAITPAPVLRAAAEARPGGVLLRGDIDHAAVEEGLRQAQPGIHGCWERAVRQDPNQGGRLELRFVIGATGQVDDTAILASDLANPELEACILEVMGGLAFTAPSGGGVAMIDYPLQLSPVWADGAP
jgi:hypothetical protein